MSRPPHAPTFAPPATPVTDADVSAAMSGFPRALSWSDYQQVTVSPDPPQDAWTVAEGVTLAPGSVMVESDQYRVSGFRLDVRLDSSQTWVVRGKQGPLLLQHEQGHYNITGLLMRDLVREILSLAIDVSVARARAHSASGSAPWAARHLNAKMAAIKSEADRLTGILQRVPGRSRDGLYDKQTRHGQNLSAQAIWDVRLLTLTHALRGSSFKATLKKEGVVQ